MRIEVKPSDIDLQALDAEVERAISLTLMACAQMIANDAKRSVMRGPKSGRVYKRPSKKKIEHQASAPGQPPATDTGTLAEWIVADAKGLSAFVEARSAYAVHLEYGTRHMAARPFLLPAFERNKQKAGELIKAAVSTAVTQFATKAGARG